jgi:hypothetical protein
MHHILFRSIKGFSVGKILKIVHPFESYTCMARTTWLNNGVTLIFYSEKKLSFHMQGKMKETTLYRM